MSETPPALTALEAEVRDTLRLFYRGTLTLDAATAGVVLAARGYAAVQVEKHARPHPWPPKPRPRLDEAKARQQEARRSA